MRSFHEQDEGADWSRRRKSSENERNEGRLGSADFSMLHLCDSEKIGRFTLITAKKWTARVKDCETKITWCWARWSEENEFFLKTKTHNKPQTRSRDASFAPVDRSPPLRHSLSLACSLHWLPSRVASLINHELTDNLIALIDWIRGPRWWSSLDTVQGDFLPQGQGDHGPSLDKVPELSEHGKVACEKGLSFNWQLWWIFASNYSEIWPSSACLFVVGDRANESLRFMSFQDMRILQMAALEQEPFFQRESYSSTLTLIIGRGSQHLRSFKKSSGDHESSLSLAGEVRMRPKAIWQVAGWLKNWDSNTPF